MVNVVTVNGDADPVRVRVTPPVELTHCARKLVTGLPPSAPGVNATDADDGPVTDTVTPDGAPGATVAGTNDAEYAEYNPVPTALVARTRHV